MDYALRGVYVFSGFEFESCIRMFGGSLSSQSCLGLALGSKVQSSECLFHGWACSSLRHDADKIPRPENNPPYCVAKY